MSPRETQAELDAYESSIAYLDHQLGLLFDELEKRGALRNTLIIITSDHGEQFGEHGLFGHINSLYLPLLHVPLLIVFPSHVPEGIRISESVSLRNLFPTVLDLVGPKNLNPSTGKSLAQYWTVNRPTNLVIDPILSEVNRGFVERDWYPIQSGNMKSLMFDRYHYLRRGDGREELYDFENDPSEMLDLTRSEEHHQRLQWLRTSLERVLLGDGVTVDNGKSTASTIKRPKSDRR